MVVKRGRFGAFLACTKYPECKGTKPLLAKTGIPCPKDGGEIVERIDPQGPQVLRLQQLPRVRLHELAAADDPGLPRVPAA